VEKRDESSSGGDEGVGRAREEERNGKNGGGTFIEGEDRGRPAYEVHGHDWRVGRKDWESM
jgi:hypothetical protein